MKKVLLSSLLILLFLSCVYAFPQNIKTGADRMDLLLPAIKGKKTALVINQTSLLKNGTHLLDTLLSNNVDIVKIFVPEHGFRGNADAGEKISNGIDTKTRVPVISLYGKNYKPSIEELKDIDIIIFDIQDVGTRFYTYISTMHYVMEAAAESGKQCIILDRPNPNDFVDGPVLNPKYKSFVGMHPIPVVHGLTVGELAEMINGEGWLSGKAKCNLKIIPIEGWIHGQLYELPVRPSPNLPNSQAIDLYPSLCFFEATGVSVGRGTNYPFQVLGGTNKKYGKFTFTPQSVEGARNPLNKDKACYGIDLRRINVEKKIDLSYLISFYKKSGQGAAFFTNPRFMDLLAGSNSLRMQIIKGLSENSIRKTWEKDLNTYKTMRKKYLLYPDNN